MDSSLLHSLPGKRSQILTFDSPFRLPPHPLAQAAAKETIETVHAYMNTHPESELHKQGKMFGVLLVKHEDSIAYLRAFSAQWDGSYSHHGFVPPIYLPEAMPIGKNKEESQRLQRLLFANYQIINSKQERASLLDIFSKEKQILSPEEWFSSKHKPKESRSSLPPTGAGDCCAPKLLQYAFCNNLQPLALAEFWIGTPPANELRREGYFYAPCSSRCIPILRFMLQGWSEYANERVSKLANERVNEWIVFEDEHLIVVNKPSGVLSVPGKNGEPSLTDYLCATYNYPFLQAVHRLDQDTSGLLVFAKSKEVYVLLQAYFQRRDILKRYEAIICPQDKSLLSLTPEGTINLPLLPNPFDRPRQLVSLEHGKPTITTYRIREQRADGCILIDFFPHTGRTHQLRVHAAHINGLNAPIQGDRLYGQADNNRLMLHAAEITFIHPITKEEMHFCIPSHF